LLTCAAFERGDEYGVKRLPLPLAPQTANVSDSHRAAGWAGARTPERPSETPAVKAWTGLVDHMTETTGWSREKVVGVLRASR
jgi:hypothetical protein